MPDVIDYIQKASFYDKKISHQIQALEALGDLLADVEKRVKQTTLLWVHANPELAKKLGMERSEMHAAISEQERADYYEVCYLRLKVSIAQKVLDATQAGMSGIQSMMKYTKVGGF